MELISREAAIGALSRGEGCGNICRRALKNLPTASKHDEFEKALVDLFAPIMECEINHPKYEDTVADIIKDVMKVYDELHPAERKDNG